MEFLQGIVPTFILRGVKADDLYQQYADGGFVDMEFRIVRRNATEEDSKNLVVDFPVGNKEADMFSIRDKNNEIERVITVDPNKSNRCYNCHLDWPERDPIDDFIPLPTRVIRNMSDGKLTFYGEGKYCCTGCADYQLRMFEGAPFRTRDPRFANSRGYLIKLHKSYFGKDSVLRPVDDWSQLQEYGGPLTRKQFFNTQEHFTKTPNINIVTYRTTFSSAV